MEKLPWEMIGAIIGALSLLVTIIQWNKLGPGRWIIIVLIVGIAGVGIMTVLRSRTWGFALEYRFPDGYWSEGTHSYSFAFTCPDEHDSTTRDFIVDEKFTPISGDVYLRWSALREKTPFGAVVAGINPSQSTVASVAWDSITKDTAQWRASNCTGTISWDGGVPEPLTPRPFQHW